MQQSLTFLPKPFDGLGVNLNATYVKSKLDECGPSAAQGTAQGNG